MSEGLDVSLTSPAVSLPYLMMTNAVMRAFGAEVELSRPPRPLPGDRLRRRTRCERRLVLPRRWVINGGRVCIDGLGTGSLQGDVAFADILERMGARVERTTDSITVTGTGELRGVDLDTADISVTAQTLAAVVTELRRAGIQAHETDDGFTINPGTPLPTRFNTWQDHRMAMGRALLGLRTPGIELSDPGCVSKTYPKFVADLADLGRTPASA